MIEALRTLVLRSGLCAAAAWSVWKMGFGTGTLFMISLFGLVVARPLIDLVLAVWHEMHRVQLRPVEGRHFAFHGRPVRVVEDEDRQRWIRLADIRAIAGWTASDAALRLTYPSGWRRLGRPKEPHLSDEALLAHLSKERSTEGAKLCRWVEREIVFPARRQRERLGLRIESLDFRASD